MASTRLVLVGAGGHALVVAESAIAAGFEIEGFYDDDPRAALAARFSYSHLGGLREAAHAEGNWIVALGDVSLRARVIAGLTGAGGHAVCVVAPSAFVSPSAVVEAGVFIGPGAIVHTLARVGAHAIINSGAIVEHECEIGENTHVAPGAALGGNVRIGAGTLVGLGSRVVPGVTIGAGCVVGAGAVVVEDVPDGAVVVGVPARARRRD